MSSSIDEDGVVTITGAGYTWAAPGHRLYVAGGPAARRYGFGSTWPDFLLRLVDPLPPWSGRHDAPNHDLAQRRVLEQLRSGELHDESLIEEARAA